MRIGIVGCGNLGLSLVKGITQNNPDQALIASKRNIDDLLQLNMKNVLFTTSNEELIKNSDIVIIALKPYTILPFLNEFSPFFHADQHTLISVATGVSTEEMREAIGKELDLFRAMPNTASAVNESITALSCGSDRLKRNDEVESIFQCLGETVVIDESLMESATILGACGVAYVLRFMRAMIQGGIEVGFDAATATKIVSQTVKGAAELIIQNNSHPEQEIDKVTTPKGCTIVGLNEMEHAGFSSALIKGIVTSYQKIEK
jgi:pyrroline-5-carboxylate reductase